MEGEKHIYFIRHGETEGNVSPVKPGYDPPLTPLGVKQAMFVAKRCERLPVEIIIASPLSRTQETARVIAECIHKDVRKEELVTEWIYPKSQIGMLKKDLPPLIEQISDDSDAQKAFPDGESFSELKHRAIQFMKKAEQYEQGEVLVVAHQVFTQMLAACVFFGESLTHKEFERILKHLELSNTGIGVFEIFPDKKEEERWRLLTWNDRAHLG